MHYIIDGYNLLFRLLKADENLQQQRLRIIQALNEKVESRHLKITVVFDAHHQAGEANRTHYRHIEIIYTSAQESADDFILKLVKHSSNPLKLTVVTSDKSLAIAARKRCAKTETVETFLAWINKKKVVKDKLIIKPLNVMSPPAKVPHIKTESIETTSPKILNAESYYLEIFEKRIGLELPEKPSKSVKPKKSKKKKERPPAYPKEPGISELDRWLKIFENKFNLNE